MVWCQWFGVNMGFDDEDRILIEDLYVLKGYAAKNLLNNFRIKVGNCGTEKKFRKAARNWHDVKTKGQQH